MIELIDVSANQGAIDWRAVASSDAAGAWIRCAEGVVPDRTFQANWAQSNAAGVPRGAYVYVRARHTADELAAAVLAQLGDDTGELPIALDLETLDGQDRRKFLEVVYDLADQIDLETGRAPMLYVEPAFWNVNVWPLASRDAILRDPLEQMAPALWVATYGAERPMMPFGWSDWDVWQFSDCSKCPGVKGNVDRSRYRGSIEALMCLGVPQLVDTPTEPVPG